MAETRPADRSEADSRYREVLDRLDRVNDPELDESVVKMGFIGDLAIADCEVTVTFRLPTFWCSANFAFLMAEDMRIAVEALTWVKRATIRLTDHFAAGRINRGIAEGLPFQDVFADEGAGGLAQVRTTFREKAFLGRQAVLLEVLLRHGDPAEALALRVADLSDLTHADDDELSEAASRYLAARRHDGGPCGPDDPAITTLDGSPVREAEFADHRRTTRRVLRAARANAEMCRVYLAARYGDGSGAEAQET